MSFANLPEDLIAQICACLHWLDIANLWFCGSRALNLRLSNGGVSQLSMEIVSNICGFQWPCFVSSLSRLSRFRLHDGFNSSLPLVTHEMLQRLPCSLRSLNLCISGSLSALNALLAHHPEVLETLETLDVTFFGMRSDETLTEWRWPMFLTFLALRNSYVSHCPPFDLNPASLPPNLTSLVYSCRSIEQTTFQPFPATLETLEISAHNLSDISPLLPAGLTTFRYTCSRKVNPTNNSNLTEQWSLYKEGFAVPLPPSLTAIELPVNKYSAELLVQLPRSITIIHHKGELMDLQHAPLLPPLLRLPCGLFPILLDPKLVKQLWSRLSQDLPLASSRYYSNSQSSVSSMYVSNNLQLAAELKELGVQRIPGDVKSIMMATTAQFPPEAFPQTLTRLTVQRFESNPDFIKGFPRNMKSLKVQLKYDSDPLEDWKLLPNLEALEIHSLTVLPPESSTLLPRTLTVLNLGLLSLKEVSLEWFKGLPQNLTSLSLFLELPESPSLDLNLPKTLTSLNMHLRNPSRDLLRRMLQVCLQPLFKIFGLKALPSATLDQRRLEVLQLEHVVEFLRKYRRIESLSLANCCGAFSASDLSPHLPLTCSYLLVTAYSGN